MAGDQGDAASPSRTRRRSCRSAPAEGRGGRADRGVQHGRHPGRQAAIGYNTDYQAAMDSLEAAHGRHAPRTSSPLLDKQVLILGAGGVARSIAFGLQRRGASVTITNRHDERARRSWPRRSAAGPSTGRMRASTDGRRHDQLHAGRHAPQRRRHARAPRGFNRPGMVVFDTVYHPENTMLLEARAASASARRSPAWTCSSARRRCSSSSTRGRTRRIDVMRDI